MLIFFSKMNFKNELRFTWPCIRFISDCFLHQRQNIKWIQFMYYFNQIFVLSNKKKHNRNKNNRSQHFCQFLCNSLNFTTFLLFLHIKFFSILWNVDRNYFLSKKMWESILDVPSDMEDAAIAISSLILDTSKSKYYLAYRKFKNWRWNGIFANCFGKVYFSH